MKRGKGRCSKSKKRKEVSHADFFQCTDCYDSDSRYASKAKKFKLFTCKQKYYPCCLSASATNMTTLIHITCSELMIRNNSLAVSNFDSCQNFLKRICLLGLREDARNLKSLCCQSFDILRHGKQLRNVWNNLWNSALMESALHRPLVLQT